MNAGTGHRTSVQRTSERELAVTRTFDAPPATVFEAWTRPELMQRWWAPKSMGVPLQSCDMDVRVGGRYRLSFGQPGAEPMSFFGKYTEVAPASRLVWTNEESDDGALTTVTFEDRGGRTLLTYQERHPSKEALDESFDGMCSGIGEQFGQLDELLGAVGTGAGST